MLQKLLHDLAQGKISPLDEREPIRVFLSKCSQEPLSEAQVKQTLQLIEWLDGVWSGTMRFEKMQNKIKSALERLLPTLDSFSSNLTTTSTEATASQHAEGLPFTLIPSQNVDLSFGQEFLAKCAQIHVEDLRGLEKAALEWEKGDAEATDLIKRLLHTLKGDFGVIGINDFAQLIHRVEDLFFEQTLTVDQILRLSDFLDASFKMFLNGDVPEITTEIETFILNPTALVAEDSLIVDDHTPHQAPAIPLDVPTSITVVPTSTDTLPSIELDREAIVSNIAEDSSLIVDFAIESKEGLERAAGLLTDLCDDNFDAVNNLFRVCHTIKGLCGFIGLARMGTFAHALEEMLTSLRKQELSLDDHIVGLLQESFDCLYEMILAIEQTLHGEVLKYPDSTTDIHKEVLECSLQHTPTTESQASLEQQITETVEETTSELPSETAEISEVEAELIADSPTTAPTSLSTIATTANTNPSAKTEESKSVNTSEAHDEMIRISTRKLDSLIDTIGETVIAQSMIEADPNIRLIQDLLLEKKLAQSNLLLRRIQELGMSLRMVPIQGVFQKMSRLIRDLAKKMNKNVRLTTLGEETELDKSIVEQIADPLMHMVRNSLDHGLETVEEREAAGKNGQGIIHLRAFNRSGAIYIEIEDDGRGLDVERIFHKAVSQGLCEADAQLSEQEIFRFIFHPGFSTAAKITDVSGRGVGMDVVKKSIEALRGTIVIQSTKGKGTLFSIRLPLTLAIIDAMVIRCGQSEFLLPTLSIVQSTKCSSTHNLIREPSGNVLYRFLDELLPISGVPQLLDMSTEMVRVMEGVIIIIEDMEGNRTGVVVDEIIGQQQIVIKNLGAWVGPLPGITGGAIMNSGSISLILDTPELIRIAGTHPTAPQLIEFSPEIEL